MYVNIFDIIQTEWFMSQFKRTIIILLFAWNTHAARESKFILDDVICQSDQVANWNGIWYESEEITH